MGARRALGIVAVLAGVACGSHADPGVRVGIGPSLVFPRGLLQSVARVVVREYYAGPAACDPASGVVTGAGSPDATTTLSQSGCTGGAVWCGSMQVTTSSASRIFAAEADDAGGSAVAVGCTEAAVAQQTLPLTIAMRRVVPMAVCGNGTVEPTEQCDPPGSTGDLVCDASCHTKEELLSAVNTQSGFPAPASGGASARADTALAWPAKASLLALWDDQTHPPDQHVGLRLLGSDMNALPSGAAPALAGGSIWLTAGTFPSAPDPGNQQYPAAAADSAGTYVVFGDDLCGSSSSASFDVCLRVLDPNLSDVGTLVVNGSGGAGESGVQTHPAIALGTGETAYVAWQSAPQVGPGQIVGRTVNLSTMSLGAQVVLSTGASNALPSVAALPSGWVVAWQSDAGVLVATVDATGKPAGSPATVSAGHNGVQDHATVASIGGGDGRYAVAWADHGQNGADVVVQRFDASGHAVPGDSTTPINNLVASGDQITPAIAGSADSAFFAVAWLDAPSGTVRARLLDGSSGFDFNNVTGQNDEFPVSLAPGHTRAAPVVAIGGSGPYIAFAWQDQTSGAPGIYGRRFPLPP
ncbi:MAG TPA: hypothetical protein VMI75_24900 [Polyangiaceae bacterium]|nr:hypothetical protein [Polyangiaceae bacterium]